MTPITSRVYGLALLNTAAKLICRIVDVAGDRILANLDPAEAAAFLALKAACQLWKDAQPISD